MSTLLTKITDKLLVSDSPWQFRILLVMVTAFFAGGLLLDYLASMVTFPMLSGAKDDFELDKLIIEFTKTKHESLSHSASLLYDFAKIALGALIASVTQNLKVDIKTDKTEGEQAANKAN